MKTSHAKLQKMLKFKSFLEAFNGLSLKWFRNYS